MFTNIIFFILCIYICIALFSDDSKHFQYIGLIILILFIYIVISGFTSLFYKKPTPKQNKQTEQDMFNFFSINP